MSQRHSETWHLLNQECSLAAHTFLSGLTVLRRASYEPPGEMSYAFFGVSIGLERMLKLLAILEFRQANPGKMPTNQMLRDLGHDLERLAGSGNAFAERLNQHEPFRWQVPSWDLNRTMVRVLGAFAKTARYYNLDQLVSAPRAAPRSPLEEWFTDVGGWIRDHEMTAGQRAAIAKKSQAMSRLLEGRAIVSFTGLDGGELTNAGSATHHGLEVDLIQRRATFHLAAYGRFIYEAFWHLTSSQSDKDIPLLYEHFTILCNDDKCLKARKTFGPR